MKTFLSILTVATLAFAGCASTPSMSDNQRLALYRAHAGAPVRHINYLQPFENWIDLGDHALAVWSRPSEGWLLELSSACHGLDYAHAIGFSSQTGQLSARFDSVLVLNSGMPEIPCQINTIRPLDTKAIKQAERLARNQASVGT